MTYFTSEYQKFFKELTAKNNKSWFDANRKRYEEHVKRPFASFVDRMIELIAKEDPEVTISAKDAVFRLNRDIRFSKEKLPYKTHMAANISKEGRRSKEWPGFYFQLAADGLRVGGGTYVLEPPTLLRIRRAIANEPAVFKKLLKAKSFTAKFGSLQGERNKLVPPEFKEAAANEPLIANKQFYFMAELDGDVILARNLDDQLMNYYRAGKDMNDFLKRAIRGV
jgi:uncharacterized protein (TIGR02453 family)